MSSPVLHAELRNRTADGSVQHTGFNGAYEWPWVDLLGGNANCRKTVEIAHLFFTFQKSTQNAQ